jgi:hypothetical protein
MDKLLILSVSRIKNAMLIAESKRSLPGLLVIDSMG